MQPALPVQHLQVSAGLFSAKQECCPKQCNFMRTKVTKAPIRQAQRAEVLHALQEQIGTSVHEAAEVTSSSFEEQLCLTPEPQRQELAFPAEQQQARWSKYLNWLGTDKLAAELSPDVAQLQQECTQIGSPKAILADYNRFLAAWILPARARLECGCCGKDHSQATDFHSYISTHDGSVYCSKTCYMVGVSEEVQLVAAAQFEQAQKLQGSCAGRADFETLWRDVHAFHEALVRQRHWAKLAKESHQAV